MSAPELKFEEFTVTSPSLGAMTRKNNFPTMIFQGQLENHTEFNENIRKLVYAEQKKASTSKPANDIEIMEWRSAKNLHRNSKFAAVRDHLEAALASISSELHYSKDHRLKISSMWANISPSGSGAAAECRPGNLWSGCYCVRVPKGTGSMKFIDPRTINVMNPPKFEKDDKPRDCFTKVTFKPSEGHFVIFPAWLYHEVETNMAKQSGPAGDYIYISFNATQVKDKRSSTAS